MFTYYCKLGGGPTAAEVNPLRLDEFFLMIALITKLERPDAEAILHSGGHIRHPRAVFYAVPLEGFTGTENRYFPRPC
jgi:hypothetical protein